MSLTISEFWKSGEGALGKESSQEYNAHVWGDVNADNANDVLTVVEFAITQFANVSQLGLPMNGLKWTQEGPGLWLFTGTYVSPEKDKQTNDASFSFTIGGGSQHISTAISTVYTSPPAPGTDAVPDLQDSIGNDGQNVSGMDIDVSTFDFKITAYIAPAKMTTAYVASLKVAASAPVNNDVVTINIDGVTQTFQPGELRFVGAEGSKRIGFGDWELTLNFRASPNATALSVGPITLPSKRGWDYLDVNYKKQVSGTSVIPQVWFVRALQVYIYSALSPIIPAVATGLSNNQPWKIPVGIVGGGFIAP